MAAFARFRDSLREARKPAVARRDYVMSKLTYLSGVRAAELCDVRIGDVHWESGQWGRFLVNGKAPGAPGRGNGRPTCSRRAGRCCDGTSKRSAASSATTPRT